MTVTYTNELLAVKCASNPYDDPAGIRGINSDLIGFTYKMKDIQESSTRRKMIFLKVYYISGGQTCLLHRNVFLYAAYFHNTGNT